MKARWSRLDRTDRWLAVPAVVLLFVGGAALVARAQWGAWLVLAGAPLLAAWTVATLVWSRRQQRALEALLRDLPRDEG